MRVVNLKSHGRDGVVYCGRPSSLGNPCSIPGRPCPVCGQVHFGKGMVELTACRSIPCYRKWLWGRMSAGDTDVLGEMDELSESSVLGCFCHPKPCHCDVIVRAWNWRWGKGNDESNQVDSAGGDQA